MKKKILVSYEDGYGHCFGFCTNATSKNKEVILTAQDKVYNKTVDVYVTEESWEEIKNEIDSFFSSMYGDDNVKTLQEDK